MQMLARGYLAYDLTGSASILGVITAVGSISMAALSLVGGAFADRADRKRLIQGFQASSAMLALVVAILIALGQISWWHLLIAAAVQGTLFAFMAPARQAYIPELVPKEHVNNAVALNAAGMSLTSMLAPALGGALYAFTGPETVYYMVSVCGIGAFLLTTRLPGKEPSESQEPKPISELYQEIRRGLGYTLNSPIALALLVASITTAILISPFQFLTPALVVDVYNRGPEAMGLLGAATGIGALVGSLIVASRQSARRGLMMIGAILIAAISLLLISILPFFTAALILMIPFGLGGTARMTLSQALLIDSVDPKYRGRVMSVFMLSWGLMPLGALPAGILADLAGVQSAIAASAVLLIITGLIMYFWQPRLRYLD